MELKTTSGVTLYRDALSNRKCSETINQFISSLEAEYKGKVVDFTIGDGYATLVEMDQIAYDSTLTELYNKLGKADYNIFHIVIRKNKQNATSLKNIAALKKTVKNAELAYNTELKNGDSRKNLQRAQNALSAARAALRNMQGGSKTRKNRK